MTDSIENNIFFPVCLFSPLDYDVGASTSESRNETGNVEQQDDAGDGVSSEGEKPPSQEPTEVSLIALTFNMKKCTLPHMKNVYVAVHIELEV